MVENNDMKTTNSCCLPFHLLIQYILTESGTCKVLGGLIGERKSPCAYPQGDDCLVAVTDSKYRINTNIIIIGSDKYYERK